MPYRRIRPGFLSEADARTLNRALAVLDRLDEQQLSDDSQLSGSNEVLFATDRPSPFWIQVLGGTGPGYTSWQEIDWLAGGNFVARPGGRTGGGVTTAWEINGQQVSTNAVAPAWLTTDGLEVQFAYSSLGPVVRADDGPDLGPRRRLNFHSDPSGALTIGAVDDPGSGEIDVSFTIHPGALVPLLPAYPVGLTLGGDDNYAEPFPQPPGWQPVDASHVQSGLVNLQNQALGAGEKYVDKLGVSTIVPLASSGVDVRGYAYVYFAGAISFGGGNTPVSESDGCVLAYDTGAHDIALVIPTAHQTAGRGIGVGVQGNNCRFALRHKTGAPKFAFYNEDTSAYTDGATATTGGMVFVGGLYTSGTPSPSLVIGTTPVTGGLTDDFLNIDSGGHLNRVSGPFFTGTL